MKAALVVPELIPEWQSNLENIMAMAEKAVTAGARLILFPEASLTGLVNNDDPGHTNNTHRFRISRIPDLRRSPNTASRSNAFADFATSGFRSRNVW